MVSKEQPQTNGQPTTNITQTEDKDIQDGLKAWDDALKHLQRLEKRMRNLRNWDANQPNSVSRPNERPLNEKEDHIPGYSTWDEVFVRLGELEAELKEQRKKDEEDYATQGSESPEAKRSGQQSPRDKEVEVFQIEEVVGQPLREEVELSETESDELRKWTEGFRGRRSSSG